MRGPVPLRQTRMGKPLTSTVVISGSFTPPAPSYAQCLGHSLACSCWNERGQGSALTPIHRLRPPAVLPLCVQRPQFRHHFLSEKARIVLGKVRCHVAELHHQHELTDIERRC